MIFIAGFHNSGKTTIANHLLEFGFLHIETGDIVRKKHKELASEKKFIDWVLEKNHDFGEDIVQSINCAQEVVKQSKGKYQDIIVTGNRQIEGITYLCERVAPLDHKPNLIIYVEADEETLYQRHMRRPDRAIVGLTFEQFKEEVLGFDINMGIEKIKIQADYVLCNSGDIVHCINTAKECLKSNGYLFLNRTIEGCSNGKERI